MGQGKAWCYSAFLECSQTCLFTKWQLPFLLKYVLPGGEMQSDPVIQLPVDYNTGTIGRNVLHGIRE